MLGKDIRPKLQETQEEVYTELRPVAADKAPSSTRGGVPSKAQFKGDKGSIQVTPVILNIPEAPDRTARAVPLVNAYVDVPMNESTKVEGYGVAGRSIPYDTPQVASNFTIAGARVKKNFPNGATAHVGANVVNGKFNQVEGSVSIPLSKPKKGPKRDPFTGEIIQE